MVMLAISEAMCLYVDALIVRNPGWPWTFLAVAVALIPMLVGCHYGYRAFNKAWAVIAAIIVTILMVVPVMVWAMFHQTPSYISLASLILGAIGLVLLLFEK